MQNTTTKKSYSKIKHTLLLAIKLFAIYLLVCIAAYFFSDQFIFLPPPATTPPAHAFFIPTKAQPIQAVYLNHPKARYTLLYSHGNAGDLSRSYPVLKAYFQKGYSILSYDYNGYGHSKGKVSEKNCYIDAQAAYHYLTQKKKVNPKYIILIGHSLGTGITVDLAQHARAAGMILESPLLSAYRTVTPFSLPLLLFDKFNSADKIAHLHLPLLIIHGTHDQVIAFRNGKKLFQLANSPKFFVKIIGAGHNNYMNQKYWQALKRFTDYLSTIRS